MNPISLNIVGNVNKLFFLIKVNMNHIFANLDELNMNLALVNTAYFEIISRTFIHFNSTRY